MHSLLNFSNPNIIIGIINKNKIISNMIGLRDQLKDISQIIFFFICV